MDAVATTKKQAGAPATARWREHALSETFGVDRVQVPALALLPVLALVPALALLPALALVRACRWYLTCRWCVP